MINHRDIIQSFFNEFHDGLISEETLQDNIVDYIWDITEH